MVFQVGRRIGGEKIYYLVGHNSTSLRTSGVHKPNISATSNQQTYTASVWLLMGLL